MKDLKIERLLELINFYETNKERYSQQEVEYIKYEINNEIDSFSMIEKFQDFNYLPTYKEIEDVFRYQGKKAWFEYINRDNAMVYEFLNKDYINALADYLIEQKKDNPIHIIEAGAGNGRLTHFLKQRFQNLNQTNIEITAIDSGSWNITPLFEVEQINLNSALHKYNPDLVLFSWMPYKTDYTQEIRDCTSVQEYILIGESDYGCCGDSWLTWGKQELLDENKKIAPYIKDGFKKQIHKDLEKLQICRTDLPGNFNHSTTVSFKKEI